MNYRNLFLGCLMAITTSCNSLDVPPMNIIQDNEAFESESGVTAYLVRLYQDLPIEDFNCNHDGFNQAYNYPNSANYTGEMLSCEADAVRDNINGDKFQDWRYGSVRNVNYFLQHFPEYSASFTSDQSNSWLGEAYFIRAYYYFSMVKRYGGVPIIKTVQNYPEQSIEELKVSRNSEKEVYDFIAEDLDEAIKLLPETSQSAGRVNKYVAYALKSRAMLYAGSIAQYGKIQLDGLLGIPAVDAESYYQKSYEASKALENKYSLYNKYSDKCENYWRLFLDEESPENIFVKYYKYPEKTHNFDCATIPYQMRGADGYSSRFNPTLDFVMQFDDVNGNPFDLNIGTDENPVRYEKRFDLFKDIEPRLRATVIFPGDVFKNEEIDVQRGIYTSYPNGELLTSADFTALYNGKSIIGKSGMGHNETTVTGFLIRKYENPDMDKSSVLNGRSEQDWIDIRYAEILLNRAEAGFQLGHVEDALACINQIRERAGAKAYAPGALSAELIQKERRMELAFENHTFWDLRRWRVIDSEINNRQFMALYPYYIYDEDKYIFKKGYAGSKFTYDVKCIYAKIPTGEIAKNTKLEQNPGY
ncbi:RagB/SusD family nutrient uptake outer membrane protein [uncultured Parabacteroides sp.]|uniref:RagB/SusD family nutrient uptake outer membrane protein n=1 Tax=uncultured Parabacteroides sp. TaxID=512312 RepID=UPI00258C623E|nr:RagB/SusD family nutrient uptake outer membrane protein [uncultured Parabacteroides sp.]